MQGDDGMTDLGEHALDLVLSAFSDDDLDGRRPRIEPGEAGDASICRLEHAAPRGLTRAVVEGEPAPQGLQVSIQAAAVHDGAIRLPHMVRRMEQALAQITIGGNKSRPVVSMSKRPTGKRPGNFFLRTSSATVGRPCGSLIVVRNPAGLLSMM